VGSKGQGRGVHRVRTPWVQGGAVALRVTRHEQPR
jgi:hypothetical protein